MKLSIRIVALSIMALLLILATMQTLEGPQSETRTPCFNAKDREHIRELTLAAIDRGLEMHVIKLFDIWLKDFSPEPTRAVAGMANGIGAYRRATANALSWNPPTC
jgi:hypothetical protein